MQGGVAQADVFFMLPIPLPYRPFAVEKPNHPGQYYGQCNDAGGDGRKIVNDCQQGNCANYDSSICSTVINNAWENGMGQRVKCPLLGRLWHGIFGGAGCLEWVSCSKNAWTAVSTHSIIPVLSYANRSPAVLDALRQGFWLLRSGCR